MVPEFQHLAAQIYAEMVPPGMEGDPYLRWKADLVIEAAHHGWSMAISNPHAAQEAYARGLSDGRGEAQRMASQSYQRGFNTALATVDRDVSAAYDRGFKAGQKAIPEPQKSDSRADIVAEAMEQCRVIAESNPSMADGAKACRRMIKKLMR